MSDETCGPMAFAWTEHDAARAARGEWVHAFVVGDPASAKFFGFGYAGVARVRINGDGALESNPPDWPALLMERAPTPTVQIQRTSATTTTAAAETATPSANATPGDTNGSAGS